MLFCSYSWCGSVVVKVDFQIQSRPCRKQGCTLSQVWFIRHFKIIQCKGVKLPQPACYCCQSLSQKIYNQFNSHMIFKKRHVLPGYNILGLNVFYMVAERRLRVTEDCFISHLNQRGNATQQYPQQWLSYIAIDRTSDIDKVSIILQWIDSLTYIKYTGLLQYWRGTSNNTVFPHVKLSH